MDPVGAVKSMRSRILDVLEVQPAEYAYPTGHETGGRDVTREMLKVSLSGAFISALSSTINPSFGLSHYKGPL